MTTGKSRKKLKNFRKLMAAVVCDRQSSLDYPLYHENLQTHAKRISWKSDAGDKLLEKARKNWNRTKKQNIPGRGKRTSATCPVEKVLGTGEWQAWLKQGKQRETWFKVRLRCQRIKIMYALEIMLLRSVLTAIESFK